MLPYLYISVRFGTEKEMGRKTNVKGAFYSCPLKANGSAFDCRLLLQDMELELGKVYEVPVKLLDRDLALPKMHVGKQVILWEGKDDGDAKVTRIP